MGGLQFPLKYRRFSNEIELNAVQRSNPEMQKRVANAIRALVKCQKSYHFHSRSWSWWPLELSFRIGGGHRR